MHPSFQKMLDQVLKTRHIQRVAVFQRGDDGRNDAAKGYAVQGINRGLK